MHRIVQDSIDGGGGGPIAQGPAEKWAAPESMAAYQMAQRTLQATQLITHFNNIAEFAKYNDVDAFDYIQNINEMGQDTQNVQEQYIRGLLINMEFLAHKWGLIDPGKYTHRLSAENMRSPCALLPRDACLQTFFDIKTLKQAFNRIYMKTFDN